MMRFLLTFIFIFQVFVFSTNAHADDFIVIVNSDGPLVDVDMRVVRDAYLGERKFIGGIKLKPVNHIEGSLKDSFLEGVVGLDAKHYKLHWIKKVFQEGLAIPSMVPTSAGAIEFVRREKGAIAYIPRSSLKDTDNISVIDQ